MQRAVRDLLSGEPVDRRAVLWAAGMGALACGVPATLAGCGSAAPAGPAAPVDHAPYPVAVNVIPAGDLLSALSARAEALGADPQVFEASGPGLPEVLAHVTAPPLDAQTNRLLAPPRVAVVGVSDLRALEPVAAAAIRRGTKIVAYPVAIENQTAAILADAPQAATMLVGQAVSWARGEKLTRGTVLLLLPQVDDVFPYDSAAAAATITQAVRAALAREAPGLTLVATSMLTEQAMRANPQARILLFAHDDAAAEQAQRLRQSRPTGQPSLFAGALGLPVVTSRATFDELQRDDILRVVIAARLRDLAGAMVDLPEALVGGRAPRSVQLALQTLTPGSSALSDYSQDYALNPSTATFNGRYLNPSVAGSS
ncbi:MAG TPA: hypothetical protein VIJ51_15910 [Solirubrobacteraceae bacterium]